ncbi:MAG: DUF4238 domain-containing protein [Alphaproteobacteria bacterium]
MSAEFLISDEKDRVLPRVYAPTFYFRPWEGADAMLCETVNVNGTVAQFRKPAKDARFGYALYADPREFVAEELEKIRNELFDPFDLTGDAMIAGLLGSRPLSVGQTLLFARFLASMEMRTGLRIRHLKQRSVRRTRSAATTAKPASNAAAAFAANLRATNAAAMPEDRSGRVIDANARWRPIAKSSVPSDIVDSALLDLAFDNDTVRRILSMDWYALDIATSTHRFFTSDQPCVYTRDIDDPCCVITLPLSPQRALFALHSATSKEELLGITAAGKLATALNLSTLAKAHKSAFSRDAGDASEAFLRRHVPFSKAA